MRRTYRVIIVSGPTNSGKTAVSELLTRMLPQTVRIELDMVTLISNRLQRETLEPYAIEDLATLAINWLDREFGSCPKVAVE